MLNPILASAALLVFQSPVGLPAGLKLNNSTPFSYEIIAYFEKKYPKPKLTKQQQYIQDLYRTQMETIQVNKASFNTSFQMQKNHSIGKIYVTFKKSHREESKTAYVNLDNHYRLNEGKE